MKKDGLEIFTHTGVTECVEMPEGYIIETDRGHKIECKYVIIAAGFEAGKFFISGNYGFDFNLCTCVASGRF